MHNMCARAANSGGEGGSGADTIIQYEKLKSQYAAEEIYNADRVGSALKDDVIHRAPSFYQRNSWRVDELTAIGAKIITYIYYFKLRNN